MKKNKNATSLVLSIKQKDGLCHINISKPTNTMGVLENKMGVLENKMGVLKIPRGGMKLTMSVM
jgi:hypothetical protein